LEGTVGETNEDEPSPFDRLEEKVVYTVFYDWWKKPKNKIDTTDEEKAKTKEFLRSMSKLQMKKEMATQEQNKRLGYLMWEAIFTLPEPLRSYCMVTDHTSLPLYPMRTDTPPFPKGLNPPPIDAGEPDDMVRIFKKLTKPLMAQN